MSNFLGAPAAATVAKSRATSLRDFVKMTLDRGFPAKLPRAIARVIGVPEDSSYHGIAVFREQTKDDMYHSFRVLAEPSNDKSGFFFETGRDSAQTNETFYFLASTTGDLSRAILITGKFDAAGHSIKGSGVVTEREINSPEIQALFQHELDFWLKKTYLKKEWRSAEFSDGKLKKAKDTVPH